MSDNRIAATSTRFQFSSLGSLGVEAKSNFQNIGDAAIAPCDINALKVAMAKHGVVLFRHQAVDDAQFVAFLRRLGPLTFTAGETPVDQHPDLNIVSNMGRTTPPKSVFHIDSSYFADPPAYTALRAVTIPRVGGETLFSNQYLAFDTLSNAVQHKLADAMVSHVATGIVLNEHEERQSWHPLFLKHPISGKRSLYLSTPARCQAIRDMPDAQAQRIIKLLYRHSIRPSRLLRHAWQTGDILIWDNRCTMHRADHEQVSGDRVLHRGLVLAGVQGSASPAA